MNSALIIWLVVATIVVIGVIVDKALDFKIKSFKHVKYNNEHHQVVIEYSRYFRLKNSKLEMYLLRVDGVHYYYEDGTKISKFTIDRVNRGLVEYNKSKEPEEIKEKFEKAQAQALLGDEE